MDLKSAADYETTAPSPEQAKDRYHLSALILCVVAPLVVWFFGNICWRRGCVPSYEAVAHCWITQLSNSAVLYQVDKGDFPPGDGSGSSELVKCLQAPGRKKFPYFEFAPEAIDARGNVISPVGDGKIFFYRYPGVHNARKFDLWCEDAKGRADGINNWEK